MQLTERQKKVKAFIYEQGKSQKEAAALVDVSEKSVGIWVKKFGWKKDLQETITKMGSTTLLKPLMLPDLSNTIAAKKAQAKQLIEAIGYNQKETAKIVGISEKTIGKWVSAYNWKQRKVLKMPDCENEVSLNAFLSYLKSFNEGLHKEVFEVLLQYKKQLPVSL